MAQPPIRIGATMSQTGAYDTQGVPARNGYLLCQKHVNEKGGVLGRKIEFVIYDDNRIRRPRPPSTRSSSSRTRLTR